MPTSYVIRRNDFRLRQLDEVREMRLLRLKYRYFFLQKRMDSLQEAFIHPPEPCEAHFIMDSCTLFYVLDCVTENTRSLQW